MNNRLLFLLLFDGMFVGEDKALMEGDIVVMGGSCPVHPLGKTLLTQTLKGNAKTVRVWRGLELSGFHINVSLS